MLLNEIAEKFDTTPEQVQQESLRLYLERRQRFVESELLTLGFRYGVRTVEQLDSAI